jgi:hypothetical protein
LAYEQKLFCSENEIYGDAFALKFAPLEEDVHLTRYFLAKTPKNWTPFHFPDWNTSKYFFFFFFQACFKLW